jgi:hypothetical protein
MANTCRAQCLGALDQFAATADQVEDQHYRRNNEQQVNQPTADAADHSQTPQNKKNN